MEIINKDRTKRITHQNGMLCQYALIGGKWILQSEARLSTREAFVLLVGYTRDGWDAAIDQVEDQ
jgi:hypothetical protein